MIESNDHTQMKNKNKVNSLIDIGTKTVLGFLPGPISAAFAALIDNVKESVLQKRYEKWKEEVISRIEKMEAKYEEVINNSSFATALIKASELAIKTESDEKRKMLAAALTNTYEQNVEEDKLIIYFQLIEKYSMLHIGIVRYLHDEYMRERFFNNKAPTFLALFRIKFQNVEEIYLRKALSDLQNDCLLERFRDDSPIEFQNHRFELLTKLGRDFYDYLKQ